MKYFLVFFSLLFLVACSNTQTSTEDKEPKDDYTNDTPTDEVNNQETDNISPDGVNMIDYSKFFLPDGTTAYFLGDGIEYATYTVKTKWLSDRYIAIIEDNGGAALLKVFRIMNENNKVDKVYDEIIDGLPSEVQYPTVEQLNSLPAIETYLQGPLEVGTVIGNWKIVQVGSTIETPYKTFDHVFILEEVTDDFINRKYFVEEYGEVKRESIMHIEGEEDYIVTSTLEKIEEDM